MKKIASLLISVMLCITLWACGAGYNADDSLEQNPSESFSDSLPVETARYGALQEIVDTYGFPIHFRMTEGMELTQIVIFEDSAEREWMSSLNGSTLHEDLSWHIDDDQLVITGEWEDTFLINAKAGRAVSKADGKEYRIVTYDEDGEVEFYVD